MEIDSIFKNRAKLVSSFVNILLVLGVLVVLFPLSVPTAEATIYIFYDDWEINSPWSYSDDIFILYGDLRILDGGTLTLDNCTIEMAKQDPEEGWNITVAEGGTFNLLNNSLITTNSTSPDPYKFRIDGTALIENSTVEEMKDLSGPYDGIQIYSDDVEISNSTIRNGSGNGVYVETGTVSITNSSIIDNNWVCVQIAYSSNNNIIGNHISNNWRGISLGYSSYNNINNNNVSSNDRDGIALYYTCSNNNITNNNVSNNSYAGIYFYGSSNNNNITGNNVSSNNWYGIYLWSTSNNKISNNNVSDHKHGIYIYESHGNTLTGNTMMEDGIFIAGSQLEYWNTHYIDTSNTVNGKPLYYWKNQTGGTISSGAGQVILANCTNVKIENQELTYTDIGIELGFSSNNNITNNNASSNSGEYGGIGLGYSNGNIIAGNNISSNNKYGITIGTSNGNYIMDNTVSSHTYFGIRIASSYGNNIINNNISWNNYGGIYLDLSSSNTITGNNIFSNNYDGIHLYLSDNNKIGMNFVETNSAGIILEASSYSNLISSNHLANNTKYALYMSSSSNNEIIDNNLEYSSYGAFLTYSNNNILYHNNIKNNTKNNASDDGKNQWDNGLEGNWWGNNSSPTDSDSDGICDASFYGTGFVDNKPLANEDNDRVLVDDPWFWFIQSGVNFAEAGWTVYAINSTYLENVTIDKTLTVIGEDRSSTIIDARGNESVVLVDSTSYVNISGFTVRNGTYGLCLNNYN